MTNFIVHNFINPLLNQKKRKIYNNDIAPWCRRVCQAVVRVPIEFCPYLLAEVWIAKFRGKKWLKQNGKIQRCFIFFSNTGLYPCFARQNEATKFYSIEDSWMPWKLFTKIRYKKEKMQIDRRKKWSKKKKKKYTQNL